LNYARTRALLDGKMKRLGTQIVLTGLVHVCPKLETRLDQTSFSQFTTSHQPRRRRRRIVDSDISMSLPSVFTSCRMRVTSSFILTWFVCSYETTQQAERHPTPAVGLVVGLADPAVEVVSAAALSMSAGSWRGRWNLTLSRPLPTWRLIVSL
jgi:hypothetical protein